MEEKQLLSDFLKSTEEFLCSVNNGRLGPELETKAEALSGQIIQLRDAFRIPGEYVNVSGGGENQAQIEAEDRSFQHNVSFSTVKRDEPVQADSHPHHDSGLRSSTSIREKRVAIMAALNKKRPTPGPKPLPPPHTMEKAPAVVPPPLPDRRNTLSPSETSSSPFTSGGSQSEVHSGSSGSSESKKEWVVSSPVIEQLRRKEQEERLKVNMFGSQTEEGKMSKWLKRRKVEGGWKKMIPKKLRSKTYYCTLLSDGYLRFYDKDFTNHQVEIVAVKKAQFRFSKAVRNVLEYIMEKGGDHYELRDELDEGNMDAWALKIREMNGEVVIEDEEFDAEYVMPEMTESDRDHLGACAAPNSSWPRGRVDAEHLNVGRALPTPPGAGNPDEDDDNEYDDVRGTFQRAGIRPQDFLSATRRASLSFQQSESNPRNRGVRVFPHP